MFALILLLLAVPTQVVLSRGTNIDAGTIGLLASAGFAKATVHRRPCVAILSTGNEVREAPQDVDDVLKPGEIRDANRPMLLAALGAAGAGLRVVDLGHAPDSRGALEATLQAALQRDDIDAIVTTGGVSMGAMDLLKGACADLGRRECGALEEGGASDTHRTTKKAAMIPPRGDSRCRVCGRGCCYRRWFCGRRCCCRRRRRRTQRRQRRP